jgi:hypothetical protein
MPRPAGPLTDCDDAPANPKSFRRRRVSEGAEGKVLARRNFFEELTQDQKEPDAKLIGELVTKGSTS